MTDEFGKCNTENRERRGGAAKRTALGIGT